METIDIFLRVAARAHSYADDHPGGSIGSGDQVAALYLMADLANRDKWLHRATVNHLKEVVSWARKTETGNETRILNAATASLGLIKNSSTTRA